MKLGVTCQNSSAALLISSVSEKSLIFCFIIHCFDDVCLMNIPILVHHTSASLTINENYDSDVRDDTETFLNKIVPEVNTSPSFPFSFIYQQDSVFGLSFLLSFISYVFREDLLLGSIPSKVSVSVFVLNF
jgi:hypothetical protein